MMENEAITYSILQKKDVSVLAKLIILYADVFETKNFSLPDTQYLQALLDKENIIFCVAIADNAVVGGLTAYVLPSVYNASSQIYIYDLAVKKDKQRQGLGKKIMTYLKAFCTASGHTEMFVQANLEDQHAIHFYETLGGHPEETMQFSYILPSVM